VPGQLRQRLGKLLEPAVVGETAVVNRRVGAENNFQSPQGAANAGSAFPVGLQGYALDRQTRAGDHAIVQGSPPPGFEVAAKGREQALAVPEGMHGPVARSVAFKKTSPVAADHLVAGLLLPVA